MPQAPGRMEFIHIPSGTFKMGDVLGGGEDNEKPVHYVMLASFHLGKYPVTFDQYDAFCRATGRDKPKDSGWGRGSRPVINVSWDDAKAFCGWLSKEMGENIRLPTEAEWEYAARECGKNMKWSGTNEDGELGQYAWYRENSGEKTHPVGEKKPNSLDLYDMSGNVEEWCEDLYETHYYSRSPSSNPQGPNTNEFPPWDRLNVVRGGCFGFDPGGCRCTTRNYGASFQRVNYHGFRCARSTNKEVC